MMVYTGSLATAGDLTTNATPGTETDAWQITAGVRNVMLQAVYLIGKGAGLTAISGIVARIVKFTTGSTLGTTITPTPKDPGMQASKATSSSRPTAGSTRKQHMVFGCGAAGPGGWVAPNPDSMVGLEGGGAFSIDMMDASNTASLKYETAFEFQE